MLILVSRWRIFKKLDLPGWKAIVLVYSDYILFKNRWKARSFWMLFISNVVYYAFIALTGYLMINNLPAENANITVEELNAYLIPFMIINGLIATVNSIIGLIIMFSFDYRLAESFGGGVGFTIGLTIAPILFYPLLAFVKSHEKRNKSFLRLVSSTLTAALVFSVIASAPFVITANATGSGDPTSAVAELFGEKVNGEYVLNGGYTLEEDITLDAPLHISSSATVYIDLDGHTLDRGLSGATGTDYAGFIVNDGTLEIYDNNSEKTGMITGGYITGGNGTCGGVFDVSDNSDSVLNLYNITLKCNKAKDGGAVRCNNKLNLYGCAISGNSANEGGAVYVEQGKTFTATGTAFCDNEATTGAGGAIYSHGTVGMEDCLISDNTAVNRAGALYNADDATSSTLYNTIINNNTVGTDIAEGRGGAVYINTGTVSMTKCTVSGNYANAAGGAVFAASDANRALVADSTLFKGDSTGTNGGAIAFNKAADEGGGIYVEEAADKFYVKDKPVIRENSGGSVYLYKEVITLDGALQDCAKISVSTKADTGKFTKDFKTKNGDSAIPADFFISDYGYTVYLDGDEAALKWEVTEEKNLFIDRNNNIVDSDKVSGRNWMSAISGERRINEINLIRAHDAAMNNAQANIRATPLGDRLSALHAIFRQISRHFRQNLLEIRQYSCVDFVNLTKNYARNLTHNLCAVLP